jgi:hypothetical protein
MGTPADAVALPRYSRAQVPDETADELQLGLDNTTESWKRANPAITLRLYARDRRDQESVNADALARAAQAGFGS